MRDGVERRAGGHEGAGADAVDQPADLECEQQQ